MHTIKWHFVECSDFLKIVIKFIEQDFPCFISLCEAAGYVRIECRKEDARAIRERLKITLRK